MLPVTKKNARAFSRFFFSSAAECEWDKQGRFLIPSNLREAAEMDKSVIIIGVGNRVEIWDLEKWNKYNEENSEDIAGLAEDLADLDLGI